MPHEAIFNPVKRNTEDHKSLKIEVLKKNDAFVMANLTNDVRGNS
jgi:hypothetical protein